MLATNSTKSQQKNIPKIKKKHPNNKNRGMLPKAKPAKQNIFRLDTEKQSTSVQAEAAVTTNHNSTPEVDKVITIMKDFQGGQMPLTHNSSDDNEEEQSNENNMQEYVLQFIDQDASSIKIKAVDRTKKELHNFYLRQMRVRDRVTRNIRNINYAKERFSRVPTGMQIRVISEVPASEELEFKREWALKLRNHCA